MKSLFLVLALLTTHAHASSYKRYFQNAKFPSQKMIEYMTVVPAASSASAVASGIAGPSSASDVVVSSGLTNPDVPRVISITPGGSTGDVAACTITINGTNIFGASISDSVTFLANASTIQTGTKAFKTVSSISFPALCEDAPYVATWSIGYGEAIGLPRCLDFGGDIIKSLLSGAVEGTQPTMAVSASAVESNTADFNGTMNGSNSFKLYFMQNYRCNP